MKISTGSLIVISSGVVRTGFRKSIKFDFDAIWVELNFSNDKNKEKTLIEYNPTDDGKGLSIDLINYGGPFGSGLAEPVKIGDLEGKELWLSFEARQLAPDVEAWSVEYMFCTGESVNE